MLRCLIYDPFAPSLVSLLAEIGIKADYRPDIGREEMLSLLPQYQGLIGRSKTPLDAAILAQAPQLQFIGRGGAGLDDIDETEVQRRGIALFNAPEGNRDAVGEFALAALLTLLKRTRELDAEVRQKIWVREENRLPELASLTVGIIGYGNMGQAFARKLSGLGCLVLAYDKYRPSESDAYAYSVPLSYLLAEADVVSLHVPLTAETREMVDAEWLQGFAKPIYLLNMARGPVVCTADLLQALNKGQVRAAALDVLENEKLNRLSERQLAEFEALAAHPQVLLSPHIAGLSQEAPERINRVLVKKLAAWLASKEPRP